MTQSFARLGVSRDLRKRSAYIDTPSLYRCAVFLGRYVVAFGRMCARVTVRKSTSRRNAVRTSRGDESSQRDLARISLTTGRTPRTSRDVARRWSIGGERSLRGARLAGNVVVS
jgi:hypothetical protein